MLSLDDQRKMRLSAENVKDTFRVGSVNDSQDHVNSLKQQSINKT